MAEFPDPRYDVGDRAQVLLGYLDFFRDTVVEKVTGLDERTAGSSLLPSQWTPPELVTHLAAMERRWLVWGFLGEQVADPWSDSGGSPDGRWRVADGESLESCVAALQAGGRRTRVIVESVDLAQRAAAGGRFALTDPPPTLERILLHVFQEYARHAGHLDVVRELLDGTTGE